jgi:hypothetical protein
MHSALIKLVVAEVGIYLLEPGEKSLSGFALRRALPTTPSLDKFPRVCSLEILLPSRGHAMTGECPNSEAADYHVGIHVSLQIPTKTEAKGDPPTEFHQLMQFPQAHVRTSSVWLRQL